MTLSITLLVLAATTPPAPAPQKPAEPPLPENLAVFVAGAEPAAEALLWSQLNEALELQGVKLVDLATLFPPQVPPDDGLKFLEGAHKAWDDLDLDAAGSNFAEALAFYAKNPALASHTTLADVRVYQASIALQNGGKDAAKNAQKLLETALVMNPDLELDAKVFGPDVKKVLDKARTEVAKRKKGKLTLELAGGTEIFFHGRSLGEAPIPPLENVAQGQHLLIFKRKGAMPVGQLVEVNAPEITVAAELPVVPEYEAVVKKAAPLPLAFKQATFPPETLDVARTMKARFLLLVNASTLNAAPLQVWDVERKGRLQDITLDGTAEAMTDAAAKVKKWLDQPSPAVVAAKVETKPAVATVEESKPMGPLTKQWWFWAGVGVLAAGAVAGTTAGVVAAQPHTGVPYDPVLGFH